MWSSTEKSKTIKPDVACNVCGVSAAPVNRVYALCREWNIGKNCRMSRSNQETLVGRMDGFVNHGCIKGNDYHGFVGDAGPTGF